jgi:hypothetical protein
MKLPLEAYDYIETNSCLDPGQASNQNARILVSHIESLKYLVEDEIDLEYRKSKLLEMGATNYYPLLIYATLMARLDDPSEVERVTGILNEKMKGSDFRLDRDGVSSRILPEYCQTKNLENCSQLMTRLRPLTAEPIL